MLLRLVDRLAVRRRDGDHVMAEVADDHFDIHRDDRFVLDDQDARARLAIDLVGRFGDQRPHRFGIAADDAPRVLGAETLDRGEQQRLPRQRGNAAEPRVGDRDVGERAGVVRSRLFGHQPEIVVHHPVKLDAQVSAGIDRARIGDQRFEQPGDQRIAVLLASGNGPAITPQIGKMRRNRLTQ